MTADHLFTLPILLIGVIFISVIISLTNPFKKTMNFGEAMEALKEGKAIARKGWHKEGMFVYSVPAAAYPAQTGVAKEYFGENAKVPYSQYLAICIDGEVSVWSITQSDVLEEDWYVVDLK